MKEFSKKTFVNLGLIDTLIRQQLDTGAICSMDQLCDTGGYVSLHRLHHNHCKPSNELLSIIIRVRSELGVFCGG